MKSGATSTWKALPIRQRLVLAVFLVVGMEAILYLILDAPDHPRSPVGFSVAVSAILLCGIGFAHYSRRWMARDPSGAPVIRLYGPAAAVVLLLTSYLLISAYPQPLFPHSITHRGITIYSDQEMGQEVYQAVERAADRIGMSAVADSTVHHRVFITGSHLKFAFFSPLNLRAFGIRSPLRGNIFVTRSDVSADLVTARRDGEYNQRTLSGVIAHEVTHSLLRRWDEGRELPTWKEEGYADYVSGESTFDYATGLQLLKTGEQDASQAFRYFKHRLLVAHLLDVRQISFEEFLREDHDPWEIESEVITGFI